MQNTTDVLGIKQAKSRIVLHKQVQTQKKIFNSAGGCLTQKLSWKTLMDLPYEGKCYTNVSRQVWMLALIIFFIFCNVNLCLQSFSGFEYYEYTWSITIRCEILDKFLLYIFSIKFGN